MSKIKYWDEASQSWVIGGASNASNLELSNPGFIDEEGRPITIDRGFTKLDNRVKKIESNLAWVYLNGAKGGGGGTGGGTDASYTIVVAEGSTVYTSTNTTDRCALWSSVKSYLYCSPPVTFTSIDAFVIWPKFKFAGAILCTEVVKTIRRTSALTLFKSIVIVSS